MFKQVQLTTLEDFDFIVSNPPYIETDTIKTLSEEVKQEPHIALDGGKDGLDFYKIIAKEASKYFKRRSGSILLEIGYNQKESVTGIFKQLNQNAQIECIKDFAGNDRVLVIKTWLYHEFL